MSRITTLTEEQKKLLSKPMSDEISLIDKTAAESKKAVSENYEVQKAETEKEYNDLYNQNNVQRIINERRIAENMANLGLTDSGLNRTQQTAAQLSYANNQNRLSIAKQKAVDALARVMNAKLSEIETTRAQNEQSIRPLMARRQLITPQAFITPSRMQRLRLKRREFRHRQTPINQEERHSIR